MKTLSFLSTIIGFLFLSAFNTSSTGKKTADSILLKEQARKYYIQIDSDHPELSNEHTKNRITVECWSNSTLITTAPADGVGENQSIRFEFSTDYVLTHLIVKTNGDDGFYIDQVSIYQDGTKISQHGANGKRGWCLSTDPNDAFGSWNGYTSNGCNSSQRFDVGGSNAVSHKYELQIDCYHGDVDNADTKNRITVSLLNGNTVVAAKYKNGIDRCGMLDDDDKFSFSVTGVVTGIRIETNGDDGFYIDEFYVYMDGQEILHEGRDGGKGWCFSTDPGDAYRTWKPYVSESGCKASRDWSF